MKKINPVYLAIALLLVIIIVYSCHRGPYAATNKSYKKQVKAFSKIIRKYPLEDSSGTAFIGTTNMTMRKPNFVIIHHTAQNSCDQTFKTFTLPRTEVSAHYVICRDGTVFHMLNDYLRAHHAGVAKWGNNTDINSSSIGIELDNNGFENFSDAQINSLEELLGRLKRMYNIPAANFIGHGDIAPTRKNDPNWRFPWKQLSEKGFGMWWNDTTNITVPEYFDHLSALRIVGFDVKDTNAAIIGFKRHWLQDTTTKMTPASDKILYQLYKKYQ
ncbi:MAG: N-acetylmuramoyl-L-alanine amidase [Sphingobacteriales bacterium]|nr:N-acetylmuramoyl-L-alanine amidase [Sphingobacteriales bacterium]MBI3717412.1 N-acetylmuramoyl-L-alanine amidase [Sphingobacteriales bacterium]